jgi:response regulator of citrate/malate metabolism
MRPTKPELQPYEHDIKGAAKTFNITEQTVRRWLKYYNIYHPRNNYGPKHIHKNIISEIRKIARTDKYTQKELGSKFGLSQAMIGRIINEISHHTDLHLGANSDLQVGYNYQCYETKTEPSTNSHGPTLS